MHIFFIYDSSDIPIVLFETPDFLRQDILKAVTNREFIGKIPGNKVAVIKITTVNRLWTLP